MKFQIDIALKIIRIEEECNLGELVKMLDKLLPKTSAVGYWKDFKLETNTTIFNWTNPITFAYPQYPRYPIEPFYMPPLPTNICEVGATTTNLLNYTSN